MCICVLAHCFTSFIHTFRAFPQFFKRRGVNASSTSVTRMAIFRYLHVRVFAGLASLLLDERQRQLVVHGWREEATS